MPIAPGALSRLPQLFGVEITTVIDFYDGPLDGLARYDGRDCWFSAAPAWISASEAGSRAMILYEITAEQAAHVRSEAAQFDAYAAGHGEKQAWADRWDSRRTFGHGPVLGWFREPAQQDPNAMHEGHDDLVEALGEAAQLLRRFHRDGWANWLEADLRLIQRGDRSGAERVLTAFGGMGSLNDIVIHPMNQDVLDEAEISPVNERLASLLTRIFLGAKAMLQRDAK